MQYTSKFSGEEIDSILDNVGGKQDAIPDLETIRSSAKNASDTIARMVESGYLFAGIATIDTNPSTPDAKVFYIANGKGKYEKFGGLEVTEDEVVVLYYDTAWHKVSTGIATQEKLSELDSQIEAEATSRTEADAELQTQINGKQEALTLTVKDNGNIVLANIQGQSKEFMPATPSGDPMHYAYVAAGAEYNDTGADIVKTTPWADMIDDDYDGDYGKTVIHKAGYWYLNGLGDISNDEIRKIYQATSNFPSSNNLKAYFSWVNFRTNFKGLRPLSGWAILTCTGIADGSNDFIILDLSNLKSVYIDDINGINKIKHILGNSFFFTTAQKLDLAFNLITVRFNKLSKNIYIGKSSVLSVKSVLYMINKEAATSPITITLHADVYNRCMVNADILAALEAHPNVSLASA